MGDHLQRQIELQKRKSEKETLGDTYSYTKKAEGGRRDPPDRPQGNRLVGAYGKPVQCGLPPPNMADKECPPQTSSKLFCEENIVMLGFPPGVNLECVVPPLPSSVDERSVSRSGGEERLPEGGGALRRPPGNKRARDTNVWQRMAVKATFEPVPPPGHVINFREANKGRSSVCSESMVSPWES